MKIRSRRYYVGFDVETCLIGPGCVAPKLVCLSWAMRQFGTRGRVLKGLLGPDEATVWIRERLEDPDCILVAHNATFDIGVMVERDPSLLPLVFKAYDEDRIICTRIHAKLDYIGRDKWQVQNFSLAAVEKRLLRRDRSAQKSGKDAWRLFYRDLLKVPLELWPKGAVEYAIDDAEGALLVQEALRDCDKTYPAKRGECWPDLFNQCRADWVLHLMSAWGVTTDPILVPRVAKPLREKVEELVTKLEAKGIYERKRDGSPKLNKKYVQQLVVKAFGGNPPLTDKNQVSTSKETLAKSGDPDLILLAELSGPYKTVTSFLKAVEQGAKEPLHPLWNILVNSGRTSCSGPNLQNQPRAPGIRETFIARAGRLLIQADYNAAEMRTLAQGLLNRLGPNALATLYQEDKYADAHLKVVSIALQIPYAEAKRRYDEGDAEVKLLRNMAKVANFGYAGGMSYMTLPAYALQMGVTELMGTPLVVDLEGTPDAASISVSAEARDIWMQTYPIMQPYFSSQKTSASYEEPLIQDWSGRIRARGSDGRGLGYCDRCNSVFQGLAADGIKQALWLIAKEAYLDPSSPLYGSRFYAVVHDEIIMSSPEHLAGAAAVRLGELMEVGMSIVAPDVPHWAEPCVMGKRWIKSAEPVFDDEGNLIRYDTSTDKWKKKLESVGIELPTEEEWKEYL